MDADWGLYAVVRPYTTITTSSSSIPTTTTRTSSTPSYSSFNTSTSCNFFSLYPTQQVYKPFFLKPQPLYSNSFSYSSSSPKSSLIQQHLNNNSHRITSATTLRSKRRNYKKIQPKKVRVVKTKNRSSSIWAWRKYGQKLIKGSLYPREYYRCSSSKGCLAKRRVEKNESDPTTYIITYTDEHNHPAPTRKNSLVGSTRQKPLLPQTFTAEFSSLPFAKQVSPPISGAEDKYTTPLSESVSKEDLEDLMNDGDNAVENNIESESDNITDDFFEGVEEYITRFF